MRIRLLKMVFWTALLIAGAAILGAFTFIGTEGGKYFWILIAGGVVLAGFSIFCLLLKPENQRLALIYGAAILVALAAADLYLRKLPRDYSQIDQVRKLRAENSLVVPAIPPPYFLSSILPDRPVLQQVVRQLDGKVPISGVANRTTVYCSEKKGIWLIYESDRHGFNNPSSVWDIETDIVAVGDSFTHGGCVPLGKGIVDLLRERFPRTINLGMWGAGPILELATLREYASILRPRTVLWFFYMGNDLSNLDREIASTPHRSYLDASFRQGLFQSRPAIEAAFSAAVEQLVAQLMQKTWSERILGQRMKDSLGRRIVDLLLLRNVRHALAPYLDHLDNREKLMTERLDLLRKVITLADAEVAGWGGRLCFVYLPSWDELFQPTDQRNKQRKQTLDAVASLDIPAIDIHAKLAELVESGQGEDLYYFPGSHFSESGYATVAQALLAPSTELRLACGDR